MLEFNSFNNKCLSLLLKDVSNRLLQTQNIQVKAKIERITLQKKSDGCVLFLWIAVAVICMYSYESRRFKVEKRHLNLRTF